MKRRACIALAAGAASAITWRRVVGQQAALPVIGFLGGTAPLPGVTAPFLEGLAQGGFVVGRNVAIEYRLREHGRGLTERFRGLDAHPTPAFGVGGESGNRPLHGRC